MNHPVLPDRLAPMAPTPVTVTRVQRETCDTCTLTLATDSGRTPSAPGQFNMLYAFAVGEAPISVSGACGHGEPTVHTIKAVGAVSQALCDVREGDVVGVRGPFGRPWPIDRARGHDLVIIAGGLGLAPLRPVLYHCLRQRDAYGKLTLLVGARSPQDLLFRRELEHWRNAAELDVATIVDHAGPDWTGRVGVVPTLLESLAIDPERTLAFVCGPEIMMRFTIRELGRRGVTDDHIYVSLERNMKCAIGLCGHCQFGPDFVCKDGPVFRFDHIRTRFSIREL